MKISEEMISLIRNHLDTPLFPDEMRHVPDMGEYYIARTDVTAVMGEFSRQYTLEIDGVKYSMYMRNIKSTQDL